MNNYTTNISNQNTSPSGRMGGASLSGGHGVGFTLTREISNRTCTIGTLTSADGKLNLKTKEGRIPRDRTSYIMWCLPPGDYTIDIKSAMISINNKMFRGYWPVFSRIPWFPKVGFYTGSAFMASRGRIMLGTDSPDEFTLSGDEEAAKMILRHCKHLHDEHPGEPITFTIIQNEDDLIVNNYTKEDYEAEQARQRELDEQAEMAREIYSPPPPEGGVSEDSSTPSEEV